MKNGSIMSLAILICLAIAAWGLWLRYGDESNFENRYQNDLKTVQTLQKELGADFTIIQQGPDDPAPLVLRAQQRNARLDAIRKNLPDAAPKSLETALNSTDKANESIDLYLRKGTAKRLLEARKVFAQSTRAVNAARV